MQLFLAFGLTVLAAGTLAFSSHAQPADGEATPAVLDFTMTRLDGSEQNLAAYAGDVVLIVNTASQCGFTPQYEGLQTLHETYAEQGLSVLGFPANNFGQQEPGEDEDIAAFCQQNYGVEFDMFSKVSVKGDDICPLYAHLTAEATNPEFAGDIGWNFTKFLVDREGQVIARWPSNVSPTSEQMVQAIEAALAE